MVGFFMIMNSGLAWKGQHPENKKTENHGMNSGEEREE